MKNYFYLLFLLFSFSLSAQQDWKVEYSRTKDFIENAGQFDRFENDYTGKIQYAVDFGFTKVFFGEKGVSYSFLKVDKKSKEERKKLMEAPAQTFEDHKQKEALMGKFMVTSDEVNMLWANASSKVEIIGQNESKDYHSYSFNGQDGEVKNINHIKAFESITYKNIYPFIDIEYTVHPEIGIKYAFIVRPGADLSKLQMLYDRQVSLIDYEVRIQTLFGEIIDHAPITFYEDNQNEIIASNYINKNNQISFELGDFDHNRTIVIDPWVQTPNDPSSNWDCVWELDKDAAGNVYVIAGIMPMQLIKYNSAGTLQWTHNTPYDTTAWLGTMATDNVGNTYVTNGTDYKIQKINTAGGLVWNNNSPSGGQISTEFWNISFNCDQTRLLVGGTGGNFNIHGKVYDVDMNSGNINSSVQVTQAGNPFSIPISIQEVRAMCAAPNGKYYFVTLDTIGYLSDNLTLCPNGSSSLVMDDHGIGWGYKSENWRYNNTGIKAIRADANFVYVHRGNILQKRSLSDFSIIGTVAIPGGTLQNVFLGGNQSHNAGIDIDDCGNIYVGSTTGVYRFSPALAQTGFFATAFKVWDVRVSAAGDIIACGGSGTSSTANRTGGVQSFAAAACAPIAFTCCDATVCIPEDMCVSDAPITLTPSTPGGTWSGTGVDASGNFDPAIAGVGTTLISYSLLCGSETISFTIDPCVTLDICEETNGDLTASAGDGNYSWYEAVLTPSSTPIANEQDCIDCPTATPNYFFGFYTGCSISNCPTMDTVWTLYDTGVTTPAPPSYPIMVTDGSGITTIINSAAALVPCSITPCSGVTITMNIDAQTDPDCFGGSNGSATVSASGGTAPYSYIWSPGSLVGGTQNSLSAGIYAVAIQDNAGCLGNGTVTIGEPTELVASASSTPATCGLSNGTATGSAVGGTGSYTYSWSPSGGSNALATGLAANNYTVTVTDQNGCTDDAIVAVTSTGGLTLSLVSSNDTDCFGGSDGAATVTTSGGTPGYTYSWMPGSLVGAAQTALSATSYTVTVTDAGGCTDQLIVNIGQPTELVASASSTPATCGLSNGTATGSAVGGTGSYTYSWSPSGGTNALATGLLPNNYTVTVTDQNGCTDDALVAVTSSGGPSISLVSSSDTDCFGGNDGTATVTASGGTPGYTYSWMPGSLVGATQSALTATSYTVTVSDAGGCTDQLIVNIGEPTELIASASSTPAACGLNDGTATGSAIGGTGTYSYSWSPSGGSNALATGLAPNNYTVTVTDQNGCTDDALVAVTTTGGPVISLVSSNDTDCFGGNDGAATVTASGGTPGYTYSWMPGSLVGATQSALSATSYTVTVSDAGGCTDQLIVVIGEPTELVASATSTPAACGLNDGTATGSAVGGTGSYTYSWSPSGGTNALATGLAANNYTVTVTDQNGCTDDAVVTVISTSGPTISVVSANDVSCFGGNDGAATVSAAGGTPGYTYLWMPGSLSGATQNALTANSYTVTVTDAGGCTDQITIDIFAPTELIASAVSTPAGCGLSDGTATGSAIGGTGTYSYSWSPFGGTNSLATGLAANTYTVTITDQNGCTDDAVVAVTNTGGPSISLVTSNDVSCFGGNDGDATVSSSGGTPGYTYLWMPGSLSGATQNALSADSYTVTVTDAGGCTDQIIIDISEPTPLNLSTSNIIDANCGANDGGATVDVTGGTGTYTYVWSPVGGSGATATSIPGGAYSVTVTDANGCSDVINFTVPTLGGPTVTVVSTTDVSCFGLNDGEATVSASGGTAPYGYSWSPTGGSSATGTNLTAGNYTVTVTDAGGCVSAENITISEPTQITLLETIINENCGQDDGSISVSASGGSGSYNYAWTPNGETTSSIIGLTGGNYGVTVTDSDGCSVNDTYLVLTVGNIPVIATPISATINAGESVQLNATGADTYVWTPIDGLSCSTCPDPIASPNMTTTYIVVGTDAQGCTGADTLTVFVQIQCGDIYVPNVFSPNADVNNDFLCIYGSCVSEMTYSVYDRWGELVFSTEGTITMNPGNYQEVCWDGTFRGKPLNSGVYAYKLYARLTNSDVIEQSGNITLVR